MIQYRTEAFSGSGVRDVVEVVWYEIFVLGNTDILDYLSHVILKYHSICALLMQYQQELENNGYIDDMTEEEDKTFVRRMIDAVNEETEKNINYALWLADKETVKSIYHGTDEDIESYQTGFVVLSDIGYDGTLYGYEKNPESIRPLV